MIQAFAVVLIFASVASGASYQFTPSATEEEALQFWAAHNGVAMTAQIERACKDGAAAFVSSYGGARSKRIADALKDPGLTDDEKKEAECALKLRSDNCKAR
jgi:hypothetical protein